MAEDVSTLDVLRNNAKAFGGTVGIKQAYIENHTELAENDFFHKGKALDY